MDSKIKNLVQNEVEKLIQKTKESLGIAKRVALEEAWKILQLATAAIVQIIEAIAIDLSGPEKKQLAMAMLSDFYDKVFSIVDLPVVPKLFEPIIHKYVKVFLMILLGSTIDATVTIFRNTGVFFNKKLY